MSKSGRHRDARERLAEQRARDAARQRQVRTLVVSLVGLAVLAAVVAIGVYAVTRSARQTERAAAYTGPLAPVSRQPDGGIVMARQGVRTPQLEIFEDFQCPICKEVERVSGSTIKKIAATGEARVRYMPFQLFQMAPSAGSSRRAANAALCVPASAWASYHDTLYKYQPAENSSGFTNQQLEDWGRQLGVTDPAFVTCVNTLQKGAQVDQMTRYAEVSRGVKGTPTVFLNGRQLDLPTYLLNPAALEAAVRSAAKSPAPRAVTRTPVPAPTGTN